MRVQVWWSSLVAADRALLELLDPTERARVQALERPADQGRSLLGAALLRVAVGEHLGVPPGEVVIDRTCADCGGPHGRPRVLGAGADAPQVSVSHSGLLVVVALSAEVPVGIDVQRVTDLADTAGAPDETGAQAWVRREAAFKAGTDRPAVRLLATPLEGYAAALATRSEHPPSDAELLVRSWTGVNSAAADPARPSCWPGGPHPPT